MNKKQNNYKMVYRIKGEGKGFFVTDIKATSKKEVKSQFDSSIVIKSIHTIEQWNNL